MASVHLRNVERRNCAEVIGNFNAQRETSSNRRFHSRPTPTDSVPRLLVARRLSIAATQPSAHCGIVRWLMSQSNESTKRSKRDAPSRRMRARTSGARRKHGLHPAEFAAGRPVALCSRVPGPTSCGKSSKAVSIRTDCGGCREQFQILIQSIRAFGKLSGVLYPRQQTTNTACCPYAERGGMRPSCWRASTSPFRDLPRIAVASDLAFPSQVIMQGRVEVVRLLR